MNLVFSYGSLVDHFPKSVIKEKALFTGEYELDKTNIFVSLIPGHTSKSFEGVVLELNDDELAKADAYEGVPDLFYREKVTVLTEDLDEIEVWIYLLKEHGVSFPAHKWVERDLLAGLG